MSRTKIYDKNKIQLWTLAAGRCQYENCNIPLWRDELRMEDMNRAYIAHIVANSPGGPRGDKVKSPQLANDIGNLMLLCDTHHRLIDKEAVSEHPVERLVAMKVAHEKRIELLTGIIPNLKSYVLLYGANIGPFKSPLTKHETYDAILPKRYPVSAHPIEIGLKNSSFEDNEDNFWSIEEAHLTKEVSKILALIDSEETKHLSVFAIAPQPLLMKLGTLLPDLYTIDVFQRHREPATWKWQENAGFSGFKIIAPESTTGIPVLNLSLSGTITNDRIKDKFEKPVSIWTLTHDTPNNDFLQEKEVLMEFRRTCRVLFDRIKANHGHHKALHVFPAVPVSAAIEFGRVKMPKADMDFFIYDQNKVCGGFILALKI